MNTQLNSFVVADPGKCIGCKVCEVACAVVHSDVPVTTAGTMVTPIIPKLYVVKTATVTMPIQCRHCEDAPCGNACPCPIHEDEEKFGQYFTFFWSLSPFHSVYAATLRARGLPYTKPKEVLP